MFRVSQQRGPDLSEVVTEDGELKVARVLGFPQFCAMGCCSSAMWRCVILLRVINPLKPTGNYMYRQLNIQQFYVLPTQCIYVFCVDMTTNSDYFPIQHWLTGFYNRDGECLLRGTDWILYSTGHSSGSGSQSPSCHSWGPGSVPVNPCEICGAQSGAVTGLSPCTPVLSCPTMLHTHLHLHVALTRRTNGLSLGTFQKIMLFRQSGSVGWKSTFIVFLNLQAVNVPRLPLISFAFKINCLLEYRNRTNYIVTRA